MIRGQRRADQGQQRRQAAQQQHLGIRIHTLADFDELRRRDGEEAGELDPA